MKQIRDLWVFLLWVFDFLVPRFVDDECALEKDGDDYWVVCVMSDVRPGENFDGIATMRCFAFLGFGLFPSQISEVRPFVNPHDTPIRRKRAA